MLLGGQVRWFFSLASSFTVLGLKSTSKLDQVKRKYYQLAKKYHPDVNKTDMNAGRRFDEIAKAYKHIVENYDVDEGYFDARGGESKDKKTEEKRYRTNAEPKFKNQKMRKTRVQEDQFQDFHEYDQFFKKSKKFRKPKIGQDIYLDLNISLQQSITGIEKTYSYTKYQPCSGCSTKNFTACFSCGGKGQIYDRVNRLKVRCDYCSGKGFKNECLDCLGASYVIKDINDKVYIQRGTKDKTILKVEKKGHSGYKANNGDLYITVFVSQSQRFRIDGNNVYSEEVLDYVTAVCGGKTSISTVSGPKDINLNPGTQSGAEVRIYNAGLKSPYSKRLGDHIVKFKIKIPQKLTLKQKKLLKQLD